MVAPAICGAHWRIPDRLSQVTFQQNNIHRNAGMPSLSVHPLPGEPLNGKEPGYFAPGLFPIRNHSICDGLNPYWSSKVPHAV